MFPFARRSIAESALGFSLIFSCALFAMAGARAQAFIAASLAASAPRTAVVDGDVSSFAGRSCAPVVNMAIKYDAGANASPNGGIKDVAIIATSPPNGLCERGGVRIIVQLNWQTIDLGNFGSQRKITPTWQVGRVNDNSRIRIKRTG